MQHFLIPQQARKVNRKHQPISEGISQEPHISSHTGPQKIYVAKKSFHLTTNGVMAAEQV